jgi:hypothetical protein
VYDSFIRYFVEINISEEKKKKKKRIRRRRSYQPPGNLTPFGSEEKEKFLWSNVREEDWRRPVLPYESMLREL